MKTDSTAVQDKLLTRKETAALLRMSERWLASGKGPKFSRFGRRVLYRLVDIRRFIHDSRDKG